MDRNATSSLLGGASIFRVDTEAAAPRERFDYWRSLYPGLELSPLPARDKVYRAHVVGCAGDDGIIFHDTSCDPTAAVYGEDRLDHLRLSLVLDGTVMFLGRKDERAVLAPGSGIHLFDAARPGSAVSPIGHHALHLILPRALVREAMGRDPLDGDPLRTLPETPLGDLLKVQMRAVSTHLPRLDASGTAAAMQSLSLLAMAYLRGLGAGEVEDERAEDALFAAACRYIDSHKHQERLTAGGVARAMACSRARLYRMFERRGLFVADRIRQARLNHGRTLLRDAGLDVGDVALRCGYADPSAFGKAFRRRFGCSPGEWRMAVERDAAALTH